MELYELLDEIRDLEYVTNVEKNEGGNVIIIDIDNIDRIGRPLTRPALEAGYAIVEANSSMVFLRPFEKVEETITVERRKFVENYEREDI